MAQIDSTYFQYGLLAIPNRSKEPISEELDYYITMYDDEYLKNVLGYELKTEYEAGISEETPDEKWTNLRDGAEFEHCGVTLKWEGFQRSTLKSPIANYVMYYYMRDHNDDFTGIGVSKGASENAVNISPNTRMVNIWNWMAEQNKILKMFIEANQSDYESYRPEKNINC